MHCTACPTTTAAAPSMLELLRTRQQANAGAEYGDELDGDDASMAAAAAAEGNPARLPVFGADVGEGLLEGGAAGPEV